MELLKQASSASGGRRDREAREFDKARGRNPDEGLARRVEMLTAE